MKYSFKGGVHPQEHKELTCFLPVEVLAPPKEVAIPLSQHIGAPCNALVSPGDPVKIGQKIGDTEAVVSAPVHASVSGTVKEISPRMHPSGAMVSAVVIENDFKDEFYENIEPIPDYESLSVGQIEKIIREAGIVGMGGAGFPTSVKIKSCLDADIDYLIVNAAECEPYITADHRLILERPAEVVTGLKILMKVFNQKKAYIGIEENKPDAVKILQQYAKEDEGIEVCVLKTKYPQGGEKQIIKAISGREVPYGKLPADYGAAVFNTETVAAIYRAVVLGLPSYQRIVTVSGGAIKNPGNFLTRVGTPFSYLVEAAGGFKKEPKKVISGGPMMGLAQYTLDALVTKGTSSILALDETEVDLAEDPRCIKCGKCVAACPIRLTPNYMYMYAEKGDFDYAEKIGILDCIECGACSYACPGKVHLTQMFKVSKQRILEAKRAKK